MNSVSVLIVFQCINVAWLQSCIYTETDYVCKEIPGDYPAGLTSMILFVNDLGEINLSMFNSTNLTSVTSLTMIQAGVTAVAPKTFEKFQNLKILILDGNHLSHVSSEWFSHPDVLETLRLSNNKIDKLDDKSLFGLTNLRILNLSRNHINTITWSSFMGMSKLKQLDLSNNHLANLSVDVLRPLNGSKIRLDGNPWDCSCSVQDFADFLRVLQNVSLLENEMLVTCSTPPEMKDEPVLQVQECELSSVSQTTQHPTTLSSTPGDPAIGGPATITQPPTIRPSTLISLIVVLCALVLVICVLSVLYHRKRERKHLQAVKPSPETTESWKTTEITRKNAKEGRKSNILEPVENGTMLLRTHQTRGADEMMSQIYHIYSSGIYQSREPMKRVSSAGPVLCRADMYFKEMEMEIEKATEDFGTMKQDEYYDGCVMLEHQENNTQTVREETEQNEDGQMSKGLIEENESWNGEVTKVTEMMGSHENELSNSYEETDATTKALDAIVPQGHMKNEVETFNEQLNIELKEYEGSIRGILHEDRSTEQLMENVEDVENLPYLCIGADPEKQATSDEQVTALDRTRSEPLRPIRRVLTWPPTAVQWKKQWAQNQHVLNVFPKLIFVTGYQQFQYSVHPTTLADVPQFNALEFLPENTFPGEDVRVIIDGDTRWDNVELHFKAKESLSDNTLPGLDSRFISTGETWRSGFESDLFPQNSPDVERDARSGQFTPLRTLSYDMDSREKIRNAEDMKKTQNSKKKRQQNKKSSELRKQARQEEDAARAQKSTLKGQMNDNSRSHNGGSPKDVSLENEYTSIGLLHEVVENHGRWTRERWRQSQINKHKLKQQRQSTAVVGR